MPGTAVIGLGPRGSRDSCRDDRTRACHRRRYPRHGRNPHSPMGHRRSRNEVELRGSGRPNLRMRPGQQSGHAGADPRSRRYAIRATGTITVGWSRCAEPRLATSTPRSCDGAGRSIEGAYSREQEAARQEELGIWAGRFQMPWDWRREHP